MSDSIKYKTYMHFQFAYEFPFPNPYILEVGTNHRIEYRYLTLKTITGAELLREGYPIFKPEEGQYLASSKCSYVIIVLHYNLLNYSKYKIYCILE